MSRPWAKEGSLLLVGAAALLLAGCGYPPILQGGGVGWTGTTSYAVLNVAAVALLFVIAVVAVIRVRAFRLPAALCVAGLAVAAVVWFRTLAGFPIPAAWLTPLAYASESVNIDALYGRNTHAGPNFAFLASAVAHGAPSFREIVRMNLGLALVDAALFLGIAQRVAGKGWGLIFTALFACNVLTMHASLSEGPGNLLTAYLFAGTIAWAVLTEGRVHRFARVLAFLLIGDLTLLAACTRFESSIPGAIALLVFLASTAIPEETRRAARAWAAPKGEALLLWLGRHRIVVAIAALLTLPVGAALGPGIGFLLMGVHPLNPSILSMAGYLQQVMLPLGVILMLALGTVHSFRHFAATGGIGLAFVIHARTMLSAHSGFFSMFKFLTFLNGEVFLLALLGVLALREIAADPKWTPQWRAAGRVALVLVWTVPPFWPEPGFLLKAAGPTDWRFFLVERDEQREVRFLTELTDRHPGCLFVARTIDPDTIRSNSPYVYQYSLFGDPGTPRITVPDDGRPVDRIIEEHGGGASCVILYYGTDCNLLRSDGCRLFIAGRTPIEQTEFERNPYRESFSDTTGPAVRLATYEYRMNDIPDR